MDFKELEQKIRIFLETELGIADQEVTHDTELVTTGLVDSAGTVRLAALIEAEAGITIPDRDINADNFDSLAKIEAYLRRKNAG